MIICNTSSAQSLGDEVRYRMKQIQYSDGKYVCLTFSDGEREVHFEESVRGQHVYIVSQDSYESIMELFLAIQAAKLGAAAKVIVILPCLPMARQDRKSMPRVSVGAKLMATLLEAAGMDKLITFDLHAPQEQCFFNVPVDHLHASYLFEHVILPDDVLVAPDAGSCKNVSKYSEALGNPMVTCYKKRARPNEVGTLEVLGDVLHKKCVIIDDMCDTAGTLTKCAEMLKSKGASSVVAVFTHPVLSGPAITRINESCIEKVYTTNTLNRPYFRKIETLNIAPMLAKAIAADYNNESITNLFTL